MAIARMVATPGRIGDATIETSAGNTYRAEYTNAQLQALGSQTKTDFLVIGEAHCDGNFLFHWLLHHSNGDEIGGRFHQNESELPNLRARRSASSYANAISAADIGVDDVDRYEYGGIQRYVAWLETTASGVTSHVAVLDPFGAVVRSTLNTLPSETGWSYYLGLGASLFIGGDEGSGHFLGRSSFVAFAFPETGDMSDVSMTDAEIYKLLTDPAYLLTKPGLEEHFCASGDLVAASDNSRVDRQHSIALSSTTHRLRDPQNSINPTLTVTGSPVVRQPYATSAALHGLWTLPRNGDPFEATTNPNVVLGGINWGDDTNRWRFGVQRFDPSTMRPLSPAIPVPAYMQYEDSSNGDALTLIPGIQQQVRDSHSAYKLIIDTVNNRLIFVLSAHHGKRTVNGDVAEEVFQIAFIDDDTASDTLIFPSFDQTRPSNRTVSYVAGSRIINGSLIVAFREASAASGQLRILKLDLSDDSTDHVVVTNGGLNAGGRIAHVLPRHIAVNPDGDTFAVIGTTRDTFSNSTGGGGAFAVIGTVSNFTNISNWYAGFSGQPLDTTGPGGLRVRANQAGSPNIDSEEPAMLIDQDIVGVPGVDRDHVRPGSWIDRGDYIAGLYHFAEGLLSDNPDNFVGSSTEDLFDHQLRIFRWAVEGSGWKLAPVAQRSYRSVLKTFMTTEEINFTDSSVAASLAWVEPDSSSDFRAMILFAEPDGETLAEGSNVIFRRSYWGDRIRVLAVPDVRTGNGIEEIAVTAPYDASGEGGDCIMPVHIDNGGALASGMVPVQVGVRTGDFGGTDIGTVVYEPLGLAQAIAAFPGSSFDPPPGDPGGSTGGDGVGRTRWLRSARAATAREIRA
ncbi:MAG: hypothetical protein AAGF47_03755 [Planctomycetota bacterium]